MLQHTATHCHTLLHTETHCNNADLPLQLEIIKEVQHAATHYHMLQQHTLVSAARDHQQGTMCSSSCNTLPHTATHCKTLQRTATCCNNTHLLVQIVIIKEAAKAAFTAFGVELRGVALARCNTPPRIATHGNTPQNILIRSVAHCHTLPHTATIHTCFCSSRSSTRQRRWSSLRLVSSFAASRSRCAWFVSSCSSSIRFCMSALTCRSSRIALLQCVAVCCSVLQCVAVCCSVL